MGKDVAPEIADLRFEFNENKRSELLQAVKRTRRAIIQQLENPSRAGLSCVQSVSAFSQAHMLGGGGPHDLKRTAPRHPPAEREELKRSSSSTVLSAMTKDRAISIKQMEMLERLREKEARRFENFLKNEELRNERIERKEQK